MTDPRPRAPSTALSRAPDIALAGRIGPDEADALATCVCTRVAAGETGPLGCDVAGVEDPDMGTVDALARMALAARRLGRNVVLRRARTDLRELLGAVRAWATWPPRQARSRDAPTNTGGDQTADDRR